MFITQDELQDLIDAGFVHSVYDGYDGVQEDAQAQQGEREGCDDDDEN